ncbi:MAG TPA: hypothetical protein VMS00_07990 [Acidimicrobiales bacterium]|nr:hypothetical protein [Acidimicrobiales bacterium]
MRWDVPIGVPISQCRSYIAAAEGTTAVAPVEHGNFELWAKVRAASW